jgi:hypothetical protein
LAHAIERRHQSIDGTLSVRRCAMSESDEPEEPRRGVKRGAFPVRRSDLENAKPFDPETVDAEDADADPAAKDAGDQKDSGSEGGTATS